MEVQVHVGFWGLWRIDTNSVEGRYRLFRAKGSKET